MEEARLLEEKSNVVDEAPLAESTPQKPQYGKLLLHLICSNALQFLLLGLSAYSLRQGVAMYRTGELQLLLKKAQTTVVSFIVVEALALQAALASFLVLLRLIWPPGFAPVYLIDFYTYRPPDRLAVSRQMVKDGVAHPNTNSPPEAIEFTSKILDVSGLGDNTYLAPALVRGCHGDLKQTMADAREETETALFTCIQHVLDRTGLKATQIDGLIVGSTAFNPTPSLSAAVVNHFKMRSDVRTFNLSGMGCAGSLIAIDLAFELLKANPNMRVLVSGSENISWNFYRGKQRSMMITNCIFRLGGVAFLMSNRPADRGDAKYRLDHVVRNHLGASDKAYGAVMQQDDDEGLIGVKIGKELKHAAGMALKVNMTRLGPIVLPLSEKIIYACNYIGRRVLKLDLPPYTPDFTMAFQHFCVHPGGRAVIEEVGKKLGLSPKQCEPLAVPFERYGNTSSSSTWYAWTYVETFHGVKKGDRLWQLGFGSGFKVCSAVWVALKNCNEQHDAWTDTPSCD